jgi:prepilin signal peptidase PulO-like enzyme (type II secretory pathway)
MLEVQLLAMVLMGLSFGSFANVWTIRTKDGISLLRPGSSCPLCHRGLRPYELVPVVSWLFLRGQCRHCHGAISAWYPVIELMSGALWITAYFSYGWSVVGLVAAGLWTTLLSLAIQDARWGIIADQISIPAMGLGLWFGWLQGDPVLAIFGGIIGGGFFALQYYLSAGRWVGDGDIRLGVVLGLALGWPLVLPGLGLAYILGGLCALLLLALRVWQRDSRVPFGPFLCVAIMALMLWAAPR